MGKTKQRRKEGEKDFSEILWQLKCFEISSSFIKV
jgi:hypothetical protein